MKVKDAVKASIMLYPTIQKTKLDVYEHMFLVIGNGYDWVNGELVAEKRVPTVQEAIEKELNDIGNIKIESYSEEIDNDLDEEIPKIRRIK